MIDIVEVASIVMFNSLQFGCPPPTLNQHNNSGSTSVGAINFSQVCTGIGRSTHSVGTSIDYGTRQILRSDRSV